METEDRVTEETLELDTDSEGEVESVAVYAAPDQMTAEIVRGALEAEGIPAVIGEQVTGAMGPILPVGEGYWGEVHVPASLAEQARDIIKAFEEGLLCVPEEELTAAAERENDPGV
jgi:hypothetical protein